MDRPACEEAKQHYLVNDRESKRYLRRFKQYLSVPTFLATTKSSFSVADAPALEFMLRYVHQLKHCETLYLHDGTVVFRIAFLRDIDKNFVIAEEFMKTNLFDNVDPTHEGLDRLLQSEGIGPHYAVTLNESKTAVIKQKEYPLWLLQCNCPRIPEST
jgi:hypothetical protein